MDNLAWTDGFDTRFGMVYVDFERLKSRSARTLSEPGDYPYAMRDVAIHGLDGNPLCFGMESKPPQTSQCRRGRRLFRRVWMGRTPSARASAHRAGRPLAHSFCEILHERLFSALRHPLTAAGPE